MVSDDELASQVPAPDPLMTKILQVIREDIAGFHPRLFVAVAITAPLPKAMFNRLRASILRAVGFHLGPRTICMQTPRINGLRRPIDNLIVGADCCIERGTTFELIERITLGDRVTIGNQAMILTTSHEVGPRERRAGELTRGAVTIHDGASIGARAIILPGITIGAGSVVDAGAVVNKNVEPGARVAGAPAKVVVDKSNT